MIFWLISDGVIEDRRKLHTQELHDLYFSPYINKMIKPKRMRGAAHMACMGKKNVDRSLFGKPERKRLFLRPRRR
jgi:hypothetical protein